MINFGKQKSIYQVPMSYYYYNLNEMIMQYYFTLYIPNGENRKIFKRFFFFCFRKILLITIKYVFKKFIRW